MAEIRSRDDIDDALKKRSCLRCGACCKAFMVTLNRRDLRREPKLKEFAVHRDKLPADLASKLLARYDEEYGIRKPCPFLLTENGVCSCRIYRTRPDTCRRYYPSEITCNVAKLEERGVDTIRTLLKLTGKGYPKQMVLDWLKNLDPKKITKSFWKRLLLKGETK